VLGVTEVTVVLMADGERAGGVSSAGALGRAVEDLQFTLGEGPSIDAFRSNRPELVEDVRASNRWLTYGPAVADLGVRGVFAFPLQVGAIRLGVLSVYLDRLGGLVGDDLAETLLVVDMMTQLVLLLHADGVTGNPAWALDEISEFRLAVHQASGMIAVQLGRGVDEALIRMRAYAYSKNASVERVAARVVARELRFDELNEAGDGHISEIDGIDGQAGPDDGT
jgi:hypothetical protein